jgi:hypothetical protein
VAHLSAVRGSVPGFVDVDLPAGRVGTTSIRLRYKGEATRDVRGVRTPAGRAVMFGYSTFFAPIDWHVKFFRWSESENSAEVHAAPKNYSTVIRTSPIMELSTNRLDYSGSALVRGLPTDHYATLATGSFSVPAGDYTFELTTDDGARLYLDGQPLITESWHYQGPTLYAKDVHLASGRHRLRVEHFQIDGYAALKVNLRPK